MRDAGRDAPPTTLELGGTGFPACAKSKSQIPGSKQEPNSKSQFPKPGSRPRSSQPHRAQRSHEDYPIVSAFSAVSAVHYSGLLPRRRPWHDRRLVGACRGVPASLALRRPQGWLPTKTTAARLRERERRGAIGSSTCEKKGPSRKTCHSGGEVEEKHALDAQGERRYKREGTQGGEEMAKGAPR